MKMTELYSRDMYALGQMMNGAGDCVLMNTRVRLYVRVCGVFSPCAVAKLTRSLECVQWPGYEEWIRP